jgi:hypothetical protein
VGTSEDAEDQDRDNLLGAGSSARSAIGTTHDSPHDISYGPPGVKGLLASRYVSYCAAFSALGGLLFGYE